jgi:hypothetical protein
MHILEISLGSLFRDVVSNYALHFSLFCTTLSIARIMLDVLTLKCRAIYAAASPNSPLLHIAITAYTSITFYYFMRHEKILL